MSKRGRFLQHQVVVIEMEAEVEGEEREEKWEEHQRGNSGYSLGGRYF